MPKAVPRTNGPTAASNRKEPYPKTSPKSASAPGKENVDPDPKAKSKSKSKSSPKNQTDVDKGDFRDIHLDEVRGEVPCKSMSFS